MPADCRRHGPAEEVPGMPPEPDPHPLRRSQTAGALAAPDPAKDLRTAPPTGALTLRPPAPPPPSHLHDTRDARQVPPNRKVQVMEAEAVSSFVRRHRFARREPRQPRM